MWVAQVTSRDCCFWGVFMGRPIAGTTIIMCVRSSGVGLDCVAGLGLAAVTNLRPFCKALVVSGVQACWTLMGGKYDTPRGALSGMWQ